MTGWELVGIFGSFAAAFVAIFIFVFNKVADKSEWKGKVDSDRTAFKKFMEEFRTDISEIRADIKEICRVLPRRATSTPLQLTEWGKEISEAINGKAWATELALNIASRFEGKSPYEIQEESRDYCMTQLEMSEKQLALCRNCAYEQGTELEVVKRVLGLELRDVLLAQFGLTAPD